MSEASSRPTPPPDEAPWHPFSLPLPAWPAWLRWRRVRAPVESALRWTLEFAGVAVIAVAAGLWWLPLGVAIAGVYLVVLANSEQKNSGGE